MINKAYLEITNVCNLSCSFCHKTKRAKRFLTLHEFDLLTDRLAGKIKYLYFHLMGEPTLHSELPGFISESRKKGFIPIITTNGSLLKSTSDAIIEALPHKVSISLHAPSANKAFSDDSYIDTCIRFAKKAAEYGIHTAFRLWNVGSEQESENGLIIEKLRSAFPNEWIDVRNKMGKRLDDRIHLELAEQFEWPDLEKADCVNEKNAFCYGLRDQIGILCDGSVVPCCLDADGAITLGNLFETDLDTILSGDRARKIFDGFSRRRAVEPLCRKCGYALRFFK